MDKVFIVYQFIGGRQGNEEVVCAVFKDKTKADYLCNKIQGCKVEEWEVF